MMKNWWGFGNDDVDNTKNNDNDSAQSNINNINNNNNDNNNNNNDNNISKDGTTRSGLSSSINKVSFIFQDNDDDDFQGGVPDPELAAMPSSDDDDEVEEVQNDDDHPNDAAVDRANAHNVEEASNDRNADHNNDDHNNHNFENEDQHYNASPPAEFVVPPPPPATTIYESTTNNLNNNNNTDHQMSMPPPPQQQLAPSSSHRAIFLGQKNSSSKQRKSSNKYKMKRGGSSRSSLHNSHANGNHYIRSSMIMNNPEEPVMSYTSHPGPPYRNPLFTCRRFWSELYCCQPWFHLTERANQRELDIGASFAPFYSLIFVWKCVWCGLCVGTLTYSFLDASHPLFQLAYLTHWSTIATTLYSIMSVLNTIFSGRTPQPPAETTGLRIRITWILFQLAVHLGATVTLLYWYFLYNPRYPIHYLDVASHGGLLVLVLMDGFIVNRIPLRWMHYFGILLPVETLYAVWTYLQYWLPVDNPNRENDDVDDDDDALYPHILQWNHGWQEPVVFLAILLLGVGPVLFCLFWCVANGLLCCRDWRRYFDDDPVFDDDGDDQHYNDNEGRQQQQRSMDSGQSQPEGSVFSLWK